MGLQSREGVEDFIDATPDAAGNYTVDVNDLRNKEPEAPAIIDDDAETVDTETGEIVTDSAESATKTAESATDQAESTTKTAETIKAADTDGLNIE